jgi:hypothetical protein
MTLADAEMDGKILLMPSIIFIFRSESYRTGSKYQGQSELPWHKREGRNDTELVSTGISNLLHNNLKI